MNREKYYFNSWFVRMFKSLKNPIVGWLSILIGASLCAFLIFIIRPWYGGTVKWSKTETSLYNAFSRPSYVLGLSMVIAPVLMGNARFIVAFLGSKPFTVLG